jgi:hypothetical protein
MALPVVGSFLNRFANGGKIEYLDSTYAIPRDPIIPSW